jgi:Zn-dependent peptidase ImmA (M78 family)
MSTPKCKFDRKELATEALQAATATRAKAKADQHGPMCVYGLCDTLGVMVRFNGISMEGMYQRGTPPRIHLSARRPLRRRAFTCAHELGHHVFGHGSSIDELREEAKDHPHEDPKEFLADAFGGFLLMPITGLRRAFNIRGLNPETATPAQLLAIACHFGVGYRTLVTHLSSGVKLITRARAAKLKRQPAALRKEILGTATSQWLAIADAHYLAPTLDTEVDELLLLPAGAEVAGDSLVLERDLPAGRLFRAARSGIVQANANQGAWAVFIRIAPKEYVGLAKYRHLEEDPDE